jgi:heme/copper-type cytochrome/quinol oxidase subunit 2
VNRYLGYGSLLLVIGWLALSYGAWLPATAQIAAPLSFYGAGFQWVTLAILALFILLQLWLLYTTFRFLQRRQAAGLHLAPTGFAFGMLGELFWTALPLLMTIGLAVAGYKVWASL